MWYGVQQITNAPRMKEMVRNALRARFSDLDLWRFSSLRFLSILLLKEDTRPLLLPDLAVEHSRERVDSVSMSERASSGFNTRVTVPPLSQDWDSTMMFFVRLLTLSSDAPRLSDKWSARGAFWDTDTEGDTLLLGLASEAFGTGKTATTSAIGAHVATLVVRRSVSGEVTLPRLATEGMEGNDGSEKLVLTGVPTAKELSSLMHGMAPTLESGATKSDLMLRVQGGAGLLDVGSGFSGSVGEGRFNSLVGGVSGVITFSVSNRLSSAIAAWSCRLCWEVVLGCSVGL